MHKSQTSLGAPLLVYLSIEWLNIITVPKGGQF